MTNRSLTAIALLLVPALAAAATLTVDDSGTGMYLTIGEAVSDAVSGDTVLVSPGTYTGPHNRNIDFAGKELVLRSTSGSSVTVIDCGGQGTALVLDQGETDVCTIEGFTFVNGSGYEDGNTGLGLEGGAIHLWSASPLIIDCVFDANEADYGGAIFSGPFSEPRIYYCIFTGNSAAEYGGAVYTLQSSPEFRTCEFQGNSARLNGGAISAKIESAIIVSSCEFTGNSASEGGAVYSGKTPPEEERFPMTASIIKNSDFFENEATFGGAVFLGGFSATVVNFCAFAENEASRGGGLYAVTKYDRTPVVENCTFVLNSARYGAGIYSKADVTYEFMSVKNTLIAFNTGGGGAIHREDYSALETTRCVAYGNDGGNDLWGDDVLVEDPLFCGLHSGNFRLCANSVCVKANNPWDFLIGSEYQGCDDCTSPVQDVSWGSIKAMYH
jgi:predicted outer membrane repeat protein